MHVAITSRDQLVRLATWIVIASEALMFAALFAARAATEPTPMIGDWPFAALTAVILATACIVLASAVWHVRSGLPRLAQRRLGGVVAIASLALALELVMAARMPSQDPFGMAIVGLHAAHVAAVVALVSWTTALARCGRVHNTRCQGLELVATYTYFVTALWVPVGVLVAL